MNPNRILGLDVARGLAILGMFAAHAVRNPEFDILQPSTWGGIVDGRSAILFATLAGVSLAILSGRRQPLDGLPLLQARMRIVVRAVIVFAIGGILQALGSGIAVILENYAVIFVLSLPFLRWRPKRLFIAAGVTAVIGPVLAITIANLAALNSSAVMYEEWAWSALLDYFSTGYYPVLIWVAFMFFGLGIGRLAIDSKRVQLTLLAVGAGLCAIGYTLWYSLAFLQNEILGRIGAVTNFERSDPFNLLDYSPLFALRAHSESPFEVIGSGGFALFVIALCLLVTRVRWVREGLRPLWSMGQMALTIYTAQVIAFWIYVVVVQDFPDDWGIFWWFAIVSMVVATLWRLFLGQGPLERLMATVSKRAADPRTKAERLAARAEATAGTGRIVDRPGEGASGPVIDKEDAPTNG